MKCAVIAVQEGNGLRSEARMFNVPLKTLRRRVVGSVFIDCKPGPKTVLTKEEDLIFRYCINMCEMGYGIGREDLMRVGFRVAEKSGRPHPFKEGSSGRAWLGFLKRHPSLTLCTPQPLSRARARNASDEVVKDFFGKLGSLYGRLNLFSKSMQIFNLDESGISTVYRPGKIHRTWS